ncbi:histone H4-like [Manis pentadactyla]|uniref:histone H4-like n=1 Tax=Manis pentadactyla TaxID=143292 RepID=UPI00255C89A5|nr:histone H4-like [Manis pentadactyla]
MFCNTSVAQLVDILDPLIVGPSSPRSLFALKLFVQSCRCDKGLGKGGAKRHRKVMRDNIQDITKPAIRRLAGRGGIKRISGLIYEKNRGVLKVFRGNVILDAVTYTEHAKHRTRHGRTLYGFGG